MLKGVVQVPWAVPLGAFLLAMGSALLAGPAIRAMALRPAQAQTPSCTLQKKKFEASMLSWGVQGVRGEGGLDIRVEYEISTNCDKIEYDIVSKITATFGGKDFSIAGNLRPNRKVNPGPTTDTVKSFDTPTKKEVEASFRTIKDPAIGTGATTSVTYSYINRVRCYDKEAGEKLKLCTAPKGRKAGATLDAVFDTENPGDFEATADDLKFKPDPLGPN